MSSEGSKKKCCKPRRDPARLRWGNLFSATEAIVLRRVLVGCALSLTALLVTGSSAVAEQVDRYRILPRHSGLIQTGGFAGVSNRYRLYGDYDFVQDRQSDSSRATAQFDNANVYAPLGPMLPAFIDVDHLLNLELLRGELLPLGIPTPVYRFTGVINDGEPASPLESSTIELYAALSGPWMYLWGETTPRPWTADYFSYEIKAVARTGRSADWNEDGVVDAADYTVMRDQQASFATADYDWATAFDDWRAQFGEKAPDSDAMFASLSAAMATSTALAIPEPSCLVIVAIGATVLMFARR
jgi:hypothetical protein